MRVKKVFLDQISLFCDCKYLLFHFLSMHWVKTSTLSVGPWYFILEDSQWGWAGSTEKRGTGIWKILQVIMTQPAFSLHR